jgi:hypothetical protein
MLVPILSKFNSLKTSRKGLVAMIEYPSLEAATGRFSESNVLGVGGFGCVYKAVFDGGVTAAVKRLEGGGPECEKEFEVSILVHWPLLPVKTDEGLFPVLVLTIWAVVAGRMSWICLAGFVTPTLCPCWDFVFTRGITTLFMSSWRRDPWTHSCMVQSPMISLIAYGCSSFLRSSYWELLMCGYLQGLHMDQPSAGISG